MTELIQRNLQDKEISRTGTRVKFWPDKEGFECLFFLRLNVKMLVGQIISQMS